MEDKQEVGMPDQKPSRLPILVVYLIFLGLFLILLSTNSSPPARSVSYSAFLDEARGGNVLEVEITETELRTVLFGGTAANRDRAPSKGARTRMSSTVVR
jgi:hypothetical protein